jgi:membrane protein required for colicin V production
MDLNYFDIIAAAIILLLGLKGIVNGFFKEIFGLVGIIGGIFIASRFGPDVGQY